MWGGMLLSLRPNVLFSHNAMKYAILTVCSFTSGVRRASGAVGHDHVAAWMSNRQHTAKHGRYESSNKTPQTATHTAAGSKRSEILKWISDMPYTSHHQRIHEDRLQDTGKWLFAREEYRMWRSSSASKLLLLRGIRMSPHVFRDEFLTYSFSWSRENIYRINGNRLFLVEFGARGVGVFLLQPSRGKSPRGPEYPENSYSAACPNQVQ